MQSKSREDVAKIIFDKYNEVYGTPTIQILPGGVARITFKEAVAKQSLLKHDKISLDGRSCKIFADRRLVWVQVHHYPSEAFDSVIEEFFKSYGSVKLVERQHWVALPDVQTGTRLVGILLDKQVPRNVIIGGFNCKTWYRGQPVTCDLCGKEGHVLSNCPIRGKCRRCMEPGHFARDCPRSPWKTPPGPAPASGSVDPTPAEASAPLVSADLRDNQLDELDSQSVFADALSSAAPSVSSGDEGESVNEDEDFETEEEADEAEKVDDAEEVEEDVVDAAALVGDVDGSDSTLDGHPSSVNVNESEITTKQCISKGTTKQHFSKCTSKGNISVNRESTLKQSISTNSESINKQSTSKQSVNDNGVAAQQDSCNSGVAAKQDPRTAIDNGVAAQQDSLTISDNGVAAQQDSRTVNDNGVAAKQDSRTLKHASGQKPSDNASVNSGDEMEYKSVQGSKRPAADDGSSDEPSPSWEDVVVSEEVVDAAARLSVAQVSALRKKSKPPLSVSRKVLSAAGRVTADDPLFKASHPRRRPPKQS